MYYNNQDEYNAKGIDYDLYGCLEYNKADFSIDDIEKVWAVVEGENDERDWRWILQLKKTCQYAKQNKKYYVFLQGGCDYTGWDCQSWATWELASTPLKACKFALGDITLKDGHPYESGMGHMLQILSGTYGNDFQSVYENLINQVKSLKNKTWREQKDIELNTKDIPKIE